MLRKGLVTFQFLASVFLNRWNIHCIPTAHFSKEQGPRF